MTASDSTLSTQAPLEKDTAPRSAKHVDIVYQPDIEHWTKTFGVSEAKLTEAVRSVGTSTNKVAEWLSDQRR